jgi:hypothetical protein
VIHSGRSALDRVGRLPRSALCFSFATPKQIRLHGDGTEWISEVMGDEAEHLITNLCGLDRSSVEAGILDGDGRSLGQGFGQTKVDLPVAASGGGGNEREHAQELSVPQEWHRHQRCWIHGP